jgi:hypothetical protein
VSTEEYIQKAEKKLNSWFGGSGKHEEAAELFEKVFVGFFLPFDGYF